LWWVGLINRIINSFILLLLLIYAINYWHTDHTHEQTYRTRQTNQQIQQSASAMPSKVQVNVITHWRKGNRIFLATNSGTLQARICFTNLNVHRMCFYWSDAYRCCIIFFHANFTCGIIISATCSSNTCLFLH